MGPRTDEASRKIKASEQLGALGDVVTASRRQLSITSVRVSSSAEPI